MAKKYQQNLRDKLKEHFREHPYFKLCKAVFNVFQEECSTMVMTPEELFEDASWTLDQILRDGDISAELCQELWTDKFTQYRERDEKVGGKEDATKTEVAVLFYVVMYALQAVNNSHYRGTLQRTLHDSIFRLYCKGDIKKCLEFEKKLQDPVNQHAQEMMAWMEVYFASEQSLTSEIGGVLHPQKPKKTSKTPKAEDTTPYVLKYNCSDETTRTNRLQRAMILMQGWGWIAEPRDADDFYDFFNGEHRACNLKWVGKPQTILTLLIKSLNEQPFFEKQTGANAFSISKNQFGFKTVNYNCEERVSAEDKNRIALIMVVLNPDVALKALPKRGRGDGFDYSDAVMNEVYKKELHVIKDLNKWYE
jgi:hypothetical protein